MDTLSTTLHLPFYEGEKQVLSSGKARIDFDRILHGLHCKTGYVAALLRMRLFLGSEFPSLVCT